MEKMCQEVRSIRGKDLVSWHTAGKSSLNLLSPRINISRSWWKVEALAAFKIGNGNKVRLWNDPWIDKLLLNVRFLCLLCITLNPKGSVAEHLDHSSSSWAVFLRRPLKEEIIEFQNLVGLLSDFRVVDSPIDDIGH